MKHRWIIGGEHNGNTMAQELWKRMFLDSWIGAPKLSGEGARQLRCADPRNEEHPLPEFLRHGIPVVLSTDDPAMFHTTLCEEYANAARMGLHEEELVRVVEMGFEHAFLPPGEKRGA